MTIGGRPIGTIPIGGGDIGSPGQIASVSVDALIKKSGIAVSVDMDALVKKNGVESNVTIDALIIQEAISCYTYFDAIIEEPDFDHNIVYASKRIKWIHSEYRCKKASSVKRTRKATGGGD